MNCSRRDLAVFLPALMAAGRADARPEVLPSKCYPFDKLPVKTNPKTHNKTRQVLDGLTHTGFHFDLHITTLQPGEMPHPPHSHEWEEMTMIEKGTLEATINGRSTTVGPGSVIYVASQERHGWKNVGNTPAQYFVVAFRNVEKRQA
jgi:quercetin dioxygenase-like cupin family protein